MGSIQQKQAGDKSRTELVRKYEAHVEKTKELTLLERFGLVSKGNEDEDRASFSDEGLAPGEQSFQNILSSFEERELEIETDAKFAVGARRDGEIYVQEEERLVEELKPQDKTGFLLAQNQENEAQASSFDSFPVNDDGASTDRFPEFSPGRTYAGQDSELNHSVDLESNKVTKEELKIMKKLERKRKRKEEKKRKKEKKRERKKQKKEQNKNLHLALASVPAEDEELETPRRLVIRDISPIKQVVDNGHERNRLDTNSSTMSPSQEEKNVQKEVFNPEFRDLTLQRENENDLVESSTEKLSATFDPFQQKPTKNAVLLLCSERFLEDFGHVVADLARGDLLADNQTPIQFIDTALMEKTGVDIEVPGRGAIITILASSIIGSKSKTILMKITEMAASSRYKWVEVVFCMDVELDNITSENITRLQNAVFRHDNLPGTITRFKITSRHSLSTTIARTILALDPVGTISGEMEQWLLDHATKQRLEFLLILIPNLTIVGALYWLKLRMDESNNPSSITEKVSLWFRRIFTETEKEVQHLKHALCSNEIIRKTLNPSVALQLPVVATAELGTAKSGFS